VHSHHKTENPVDPGRCSPWFIHFSFFILSLTVGATDLRRKMLVSSHSSIVSEERNTTRRSTVNIAQHYDSSSSDEDEAGAASFRARIDAQKAMRSNLLTRTMSMVAVAGKIADDALEVANNSPKEKVITPVVVSQSTNFTSVEDGIIDPISDIDDYPVFDHTIAVNKNQHHDKSVLSLQNPNELHNYPHHQQPGRNSPPLQHASSTVHQTTQSTSSVTKSSFTQQSNVTSTISSANSPNKRNDYSDSSDEDEEGGQSSMSFKARIEATVRPAATALSDGNKCFGVCIVETTEEQPTDENHVYGGSDRQALRGGAGRG